MSQITDFSEEQERAIDKIVEWYGIPEIQEFYLAGFAGVGKTTLANEAIKRICHQYKVRDVYTAAYTGKAAFVLRSKGIDNASTIHGLIYQPVEDPETGETSFVKSETSPAATAHLLVLDECSMVDEKLAEDLRSFGKKILVMGDPGQLPPVKGQGSFTNRAPDVFLKEVHRQAKDSPILELATLARQGKPIPRNYHKGDVRVMPLTKTSSEAIYNPETQVLCGLNKVRWTITQLMRKALLFEGNVPIVGERIMCVKNDNIRGLFNGGIGILDSLEFSIDPMTGNEIYDIDATIEDVRYHELLTDPYMFNKHFDNGASQKLEQRRLRYQEFDWAYALSVHKAQGSGFQHCTIIDDSRSFGQNRDNHLYTAITRCISGMTLLLR